MPFINDDFLLTTRAAKELYHGYAEHMPIIDYHCHLSPKQIAEDYKFKNATDLFLGGDHYKWRQMRTAGIDERYPPPQRASPAARHNKRDSYFHPQGNALLRGARDFLRRQYRSSYISMW